jgi:large subunit ribosomal protein L29
MKAKDLKGKNASELNNELTALFKTQFNLRMQKATQQLTNTGQIKAVRRDIARVKTVMGQKGGAQ